MSKTELFEEITKLSAAERSELWDTLWTLEERDRPGTSVPTEKEKALLDRELEEYAKNPDPGSPWRKVEARLRTGL